jgi:hypothetical protein
MLKANTVHVGNFLSLTSIDAVIVQAGVLLLQICWRHCPTGKLCRQTSFPKHSLRNDVYVGYRDLINNSYRTHPLSNSIITLSCHHTSAPKQQQPPLQLSPLSPDF